MIVQWEPLNRPKGPVETEKSGDKASQPPAAGVHLGAPSRGEEEARLVVKVLGVVEAKANPNDVGPALAKMQETLAFLTGDRKGYDPVSSPFLS